MKALIKLIIKLSLVSSLALLSVSCQDPILYHIKQEVKLETATLLGDIYQVSRFTKDSKEVLYIANGNLYTKAIDNTAHGAWVKQTNVPEGHIQAVVSDSDYLYLFVTNFVKYEIDGETKISSRKIYCSKYDENKWHLCDVSEKTNSTSKTHKVQLFSTNAVKRSHRYAYVNAGGSVYKLSGTSYSDTGNKDKFSCAWLNGTIHFFNFSAACTDETSSSDPTCAYFSHYGEIKKIDGSTGKESQVSSTANTTITGMAVMKDSILITTNSGALLVDIATGKEIEFANLTSTLSTLYETYAPLAVYPEKPALENIVYASNQVYGTGSNSAQFTHQGLWSYYPERNKWNIE